MGNANRPPTSSQSSHLPHQQHTQIWRTHPEAEQQLVAALADSDLVAAQAVIVVIAAVDVDVVDLVVEQTRTRRRSGSQSPSLVVWSRMERSSPSRSKLVPVNVPDSRPSLSLVTLRDTLVSVSRPQRKLLLLSVPPSSSKLSVLPIRRGYWGTNL